MRVMRLFRAAKLSTVCFLLALAFFGVGASAQAAPPIFNGDVITRTLPTYNVKAYGAKGDGTTNDTAAIQAAVNAASAGGTVFFPGGTYVISSTITIPVIANVTNPQTYPVIFRGSGTMEDGFWSTLPFGTVLLAKNLAGDMFATPSTSNIGAAVAFEDMTIVGNDTGMGGTQTAGDLLHIYNPMEAWFRDILVRGSYADGIRLDSAGVAGNMVSIDHIRVEKCGSGGNGVAILGTVQSIVAASHFESCTIGITVGTQADQTEIISNTFQNNSYQAIQSGGREGVYADNWIGQSGREGIQLTGARNLIEGNTFVSNGTSGTDPKGIRLYNATYTTVIGNLSADTGSGTQKYGFAEEGSADYNVIVNNDFRNNVTSAVFGIVGAHTILRNNAGYNPVGHSMTQPAVPASGTAYTNNGPVDATVFVSGGTVTAIAIGGTSTGLTSGAFRVPVGQTITLTYSVAPTWQWFGD